MTREVDRARENYRHRYCPDWKNVYDGYNIMIDSSRFGIEKCSNIWADIVRSEILQRQIS